MNKEMTELMEDSLNKQSLEIEEYVLELIDKVKEEKICVTEFIKLLKDKKII